jgi:hypothetical protein
MRLGGDPNKRERQELRLRRLFAGPEHCQIYQAGTSRWCSLPAQNPGSLEHEHHAGLVAEIALVIVAVREIIPKTSQEIIELCWPYRDVLGEFQVDASPDQEIKGIVAGRSGADAA